ncbi:MAG TPA: antA/AntB antirepressor family protein [Emticicia sp.]
MLTNHGGEYPYRMTELYEKLELAPKAYARWVKLNLLESFYPAKDYLVVNTMLTTAKGGHKRQEYELTARATEELALLSKTKQGKALRKWLLDLKDKVEANELLTLEQVYFLIDLVNVFSFVVYQKAAEERHKQIYIENYLDTHGKINIAKICQEFNLMRNGLLNISPEAMAEKVKRFFDEEGRLADQKTKRGVLGVIERYSLIGNAAFDFMASIDRPYETAIQVSDMVKGLADRMQVEIRDKNEADLFNEEKDLNFNVLRKINPYVGKAKLNESIKEKLKNTPSIE